MLLLHNLLQNKLSTGASRQSSLSELMYAGMPPPALPTPTCQFRHGESSSSVVLAVTGPDVLGKVRLALLLLCLLSCLHLLIILLKYLS